MATKWWRHCRLLCGGQNKYFLNQNSDENYEGIKKISSGGGRGRKKCKK
jgi:hypothetical protein